jgi:tetratricopeptide (TPR) repeat protein
VIAAVAATAVLLLAAAFFGRAALRRGTVLAAIPQRPDLGSLPSELGTEFDASEAMAHSYVHSVDGLARLSRLYHANSFYNEALQCYEALRRLEPRNAKWPHLESSILSQFGRQDEALPREEAAVALAPDYIPARLRLGDELLMANRRQEAAAAYSQVLEREPGEPYAMLGLAKCDVAAGDWSKAIERLRECVKLHPDFIGAMSLMVTTYEHMGRQAEANAMKNVIGRREFTDLSDPWLDGLIDDCFDSYRLSVVAAVADFSGKRDAAKQMLERAIAFAPKNSSFHRQLAIKLALDKDLPSACEHLERAVALSPTDNDSWLLLYQYRKMMGQAPAAEQALRSGLANCPQSASLHIEEARRLSSAGRNEEAIGEFKEAYRLNPSESGPLVQLSTVLLSLNRGDEAVAALLEGLGKQPEDPAALAMLTYVYIVSGNEAQARQWWAHVRLQPRTPPDMVRSLQNEYRQRFGRDLD